MPLLNRYKLLLLCAAFLLAGAPGIVSANCSNNYGGNTMGVGGCTGNVIYSVNTKLVGEVNVSGDIVVNAGITLTTNGFIVLAGNSINWNGATIQGGNDTNIPGGNAGGAGGACNTNPNPTIGTHNANSYAGSGGGGGGSACANGNGAPGGNTLVIGGRGYGNATNDGSTPAAPSITNTLIQTWYNGGGSQQTTGIQAYMASASGGGAQRGSSGIGAGAGGYGVYGIYLQSPNIYEGTTNATGQHGQLGGGDDDGGSAGGGFVVIAYKTDHSMGTNTIGGGTTSNGGAGGNGREMWYAWTTAPLKAAGVSSGVVISASPNPFAYPTTGVTSFSVTATCTPNTDTCNVEAPQANVLATGTGSAVFTSNTQNYGVGTYTFYGNDITSNLQTSTTLTINPGNVIVACTRQGQAVTNGQNDNSLFANTLVSCTLTSYNNQVATGNLLLNNIVQAQGSSMSANPAWNNQLNNWVANTLPTANYSSNSIAWTDNDIPYILGSYTSTSPAYETSNQLYQTDVNITKAASSANIVLYINGNNVNTANQVITPPNNNVFNNYFSIPLLPTNNVVWNTQVALSIITNSYGTISVNSLATSTQTELQNYFPGLTLNTIRGGAPTNAILGDNVTANTIITQHTTLNNAGVAGYLQVGNQIVTESVLGSYSFQAFLASFNSSKYNLGLPTTGVGNTINPQVNSIVQLSFMNANVFRNVSANLNVYNETLTACSTAYPANAFLWAFRPASAPTTAWTTNVLLQGFYNLINNGYHTPTIPGLTAGFTATATSNTYVTCMYPSWATFKTSGSVQYQSANSLKSNAYLQLVATSNTQTALVNYIENQSSPLSYEVEVQNASTLLLMRSLVKVLLYNINTNNGILVNELNVSATNGAFTTLNESKVYQLQAFTPDGKTLLATQTITAAACSTASCLVIIVVGNFTSNLPATQFADINATCSQAAIPGNMENVNCAVNSKSGKTYAFNLAVKNAVSGAIVCSQNLTASNGALACSNVPHTNNTGYTWQLSVRINGVSYALRIGSFGVRTINFGTDGVFFAILAVLALVLIVATKEPILGVVAFGVGWTFVSVTGFIYTPTSVLGFLWLMVAVVCGMIYLARRR